MPRGKKRTMDHATGRPQAPQQPQSRQVPTHVRGPVHSGSEQHNTAGGLMMLNQGRASSPAHSLPTIDQTMLMEALREYARDSNVVNLKEKLKGMMEILLSLVDHNTNDNTQVGYIKMELLRMIFQMVKEDFVIEENSYGKLVWQSPKLIRSMQVLLVIFVSVMSHQTFALIELLGDVLDFSRTLLVQFGTIQSLNLESHVITLATLNLRIFSRYNKDAATFQDFARETVFELLHKSSDNYIWQENPIQFLKDLPNSYTLIWAARSDKELDHIFDSVFSTSTKDHLKGLYADTIAISKTPLTNSSRNGPNLNLEFLYTFLENPSREPKKVDRTLDILCQIITCNNADYTVLFPSKDMIEEYILPLLYHDKVYIKVRAGHLIAVWIKSFLFRFPHGPDKEAIMESIAGRLFSAIHSDSNLAVQLAVSRCIISLYGGSNGYRDIPNSVGSGGVIKSLTRIYCNFPYECSPLLAANLILKISPGTIGMRGHVKVFEYLCDLLAQTCKSISFCDKYGYDEIWCRSQDIIRSVIDILKGLEVYLAAAKRHGSYTEPRSRLKIEDKLLENLVFIYREFENQNLDVCVAALKVQSVLHEIVCTRRILGATKQFIFNLRRSLRNSSPPQESSSEGLVAAEFILAKFGQLDPTVLSAS